MTEKPFNVSYVLLFVNVHANMVHGWPLLLLLNALVAWFTFRYKRAEQIIEHSPTVLVKHGRILHENLRRERVSMPELRTALRKEGVVSLRDVRYAILEEDGHLSVLTRKALA